MDKLVNHPIAELVAQHLRASIASGEFQPGEKVPIDTAAAVLGTSSTPVRDALRALQGEGLVDIVPRVGVFVRSIGVSEVLEVYALKQALEPLIVEWATSRATVAERQEFLRGAPALKEIAAAGDLPEYVRLIEERRIRLVEMARSDVVRNVLATIDGRVRSFRHRNLSQGNRMRESALEHCAIAEAIASGDARLAADLARDHMRAATDSLRAMLASADQLADAG